MLFPILAWYLSGLFWLWSTWLIIKLFRLLFHPVFKSREKLPTVSSLNTKVGFFVCLFFQLSVQQSKSSNQEFLEYLFFDNWFKSSLFCSGQINIDNDYQGSLYLLWNAVSFALYCVNMSILFCFFPFEFYWGFFCHRFFGNIVIFCRFWNKPISPSVGH